MTEKPVELYPTQVLCSFINTYNGERETQTIKIKPKSDEKHRLLTKNHLMMMTQFWCPRTKKIARMMTLNAQFVIIPILKTKREKNG